MQHSLSWRNPAIDAAEVEKLATELIERENNTDWQYEIGIPERYVGSIWTVFVRWISPDGDLLDGPGVIRVNEDTGKAWFHETC